MMAAPLQSQPDVHAKAPSASLANPTPPFKHKCSRHNLPLQQHPPGSDTSRSTN
jgi:hypothetical protein